MLLYSVTERLNTCTYLANQNRTHLILWVEQTKSDGFVLDEDIALTHAPQETFEGRQKSRQYHTSNEPS